MAACGENFIIPQKVNHSLVALSSGEEKCAPCHSWGAGVRSHYLIHYVISGKGVFYCGTNKVADNRRSLGLGLFLCKAIVEAHGGTIHVRDNVPHGTVFSFLLPLEEIPNYE